MANAAVRERDDVTATATAPTTPLRAHRNSAAAKALSRPRIAKRLGVVRDQAPVALPLPAFQMGGSVDVGRGPIARMVETGRGRLLVTNPGVDGVAVVDAARMAVVATAGDVYEPFAVAQARGRAYVSGVTVAFDELVVLDPATGALQTTYPMEGSVRDVVASRDGSHVYVSRFDYDGADVAVFDTATQKLTSIPVGGGNAVADAVAVSGDGSRLYVGVSLNFANDLLVIDTATAAVVDTVIIDAPIRGIAVAPTGGYVYVLSSDPAAGGAVHTVDARSGEVVAVAQVGGLPTALSISRDGGRLYVSDVEQVTVLCTATSTVVDALDVEAEPSCVLESADGSVLYVADYDGRVTVFAMVGAGHPEPTMPTIRRQPQLAEV